MTDQMRFDALGANGNETVRTPNLDTLAGEGCRFSSCIVQAPVCVPSRQTFFTGRYPHSHRNRVNYTRLDDREVLLQRMFQTRGYRTGFVGKLHYWPPTREHALSTGFDEGVIHDGGPCDEWSDYVGYLAEHHPEWLGRYRELRTDAHNPFTAAIPDELHETTWCGEQTRSMMRRLASQDEPWFLFSSYWKPHAPLEVPEPWASMYNNVDVPVPAWHGEEHIDSFPEPLQLLARRGDADPYLADREIWKWIYRAYYGAVSQIDREVGRSLSLLDELGLASSTIVVFCSDHGDFLMEHGMTGKNAFFESAIRVPMLVSYPGIVSADSYDELFESTDVVPTLLDLCGIETPARVQGHSVANRISGGRVGEERQPREFVFGENVIPEVITGGGHDFRFEPGEGIKGIRHPDAKMIRGLRWKYVYYPGNGHELYDLQSDPDELHNLADLPGHEARVHEMRRRLLDWMITADENDQIAPRWLL